MYYFNKMDIETNKLLKLISENKYKNDNHNIVFVEESAYSLDGEHWGDTKVYEIINRELINNGKNKGQIKKLYLKKDNVLYYALLRKYKDRSWWKFYYQDGCKKPNSRYTYYYLTNTPKKNNSYLYLQ